MNKRLTILRILTVHCDEIVPLVSQSLEGELTFLQRVAVRAHMLSCASCRRFKRQMVLFRKTLQRLGLSDEPVMAGDSISLSPEAKQRIRSHLRTSG